MLVTFEENKFILHVLYMYTYPKGVQDTYQVHRRYIKIHVSCAIPWCHTGYISRYIRIRVSWILHQDTSGNIRIHRDTKSRYMYLGRDTCGIQSELLTSNVSREVLYVTEMQDTCNIHSGYIRDTCICRGDQDTCRIHVHAAYM